jgi:hypothetical protein
MTRLVLIYIDLMKLLQLFNQTRMMKNLLFVFLLVSLFSCKESSIQIAKPSTFVRYFNGGLADSAQNIIETSDNGFLILANSVHSNNLHRIKLIKTDQYGNESWTQLYPADNGSPLDYRGFGLTPISVFGTNGKKEDVGYLIVGQEIYGSAGKSGLFMLLIDPTDGTVKDSVTKKKFPLPNTSPTIFSEIQTRGVATIVTDSSYIVLSEDINDSPDDMLLTEIKPVDKSSKNLPASTDTLAISWFQKYGAGSTHLAKNLYYNSGTNYFSWGGTNIASGSLMTFDQTRYNNPGTSNFQQYPTGLPTSVYFTGNDLALYGETFGIVGSRGSSGDGKFQSLFFSVLSKLGDRQDTVSFKFNYSQKTETGNSVCASTDGGFLILGSIANDNAETDTDYLLLKVGLNGGGPIGGKENYYWKKQYGGKSKDLGVKVIQSSDGGYVVLGTTQLANVPSVFLMKTDGNGGIQ